MGDALAQPVVAPAEPAPAPAEATPVEGQSAEPAPPPTYEPFTLPEGFAVEPERMGEFTGLLGEFEGLTKADHAAVQAFGQKLLDRHLAETQRAVAEVQRGFQSQQDEQATTWLNAFKSDPDIGGERAEATIQAARQFIQTHGGTDEQQAEIRQLMDETRAGNHPALIRLLARAGVAMSEGRPLAARPTPLPLSRTQKMYGGTR